jgi:aminomethyltransferase
MGKETALFNAHKQHNASMTEFAGWNMPLHYGSQLEEHKTVRETAGVFDVSHMRSVDLKGEKCAEFLRHLLANDVAKLKNDGQALYTVMLKDDGGIIDDLIVYRLSETYYRLVVNAATTQKDLAWIDNQISKFNISITPRDDLAMLAIQGPKAFDILRSSFADKFEQVLSTLKRFCGVQLGDWLIAYTGYTGENGVEVILPKQEAAEFFNALVAAGIAPIGLGARDTLRLEAGLNLYGQDMDESESPYSSNLAWTVDLKDEQREFIGKSALAQIKSEGNYKRLIALALEDKGVVRPGMTVLNQSNEVLGKITSGTFSPTAQSGIGLARVILNPEDSYFIEVRGKKLPAQKIKLPFVKNGQKNF